MREVAGLLREPPPAGVDADWELAQLERICDAPLPSLDRRLVELAIAARRPTGS